MAPTLVPVVLDSGALYRSSGVMRVACQHVAEWLVWYERLQVARGRCRALVVYQSMGDSSLSGDTHVCGSATDWQYLGEGAVMDAREMGAPATWARIRSLGWTTGDHVHSVLSCGDNACNGYQIQAALDGYNGLGYLGRGGVDPHRSPSTARTWRQGIEWAKAEIARLSKGEDEMATIAEITAAVDGVVRTAVREALEGQPKTPPTPDQIAAIYGVLTGREPSRSEAGYWVEMAAAQGWGYSETREQIARTDEARQHAITVAYADYLGREAGEMERAGWMAAGSADVILAGVWGSDEAKARRAA